MRLAESWGMKVASEPEALLQVLMNPPTTSSELDWKLASSQWLFSALGEAGLPVICVETRHMARGVEGADQQDGPRRCTRHRADDAVGLYRPVHVKTLRSQKLRML